MINKMGLQIKTDCSGVDWQSITQLLKAVGMAYHEPEVHQRAFEASYAKVFVYEGSQLIGFGRAISDGEYQSAIYDVAVLPDAQGKGVGKIIIETVLNRLPDSNIILYANPGKENFYKQFGFGLLKTGMGRFTTGKAMEKFTE